MDERIKSFLTKSIWLALPLFAVRYFVFGIETLCDFIGAVGEIATLTLIFMVFYSEYLWRYIPFEKIPRIMGKYTGRLEYNYKGTPGNKRIDVTIRQTLFSVKISITTDEITSDTIVGDLVKENDEYVVYYVYKTNPKSKFSLDNPMQYGACRMVPQGKKELKGVYWTNRQTIGDMKLKKVK